MVMSVPLPLASGAATKVAVATVEFELKIVTRPALGDGENVSRRIQHRRDAADIFDRCQVDGVPECEILDHAAESRWRGGGFPAKREQVGVPVQKIEFDCVRA